MCSQPAMATNKHHHHQLLFFFFFSHVLITSTTLAQGAAGGGGGSWQTLLKSSGIASMHSAVTRFGHVVLLDRNEIGPSQLPLPPGQCGADPECTAHSALFDPATNTLRPLSIVTDTVCSAGQFLPDGTLLQIGGSGNGWSKLRTFAPCADGACDWHELDSPTLAAGRWYSTSQILPDGSVIIVGGIATDTVEFYPPSASVPTRHLQLLADTSDAQYDNLYPYVSLLPNGHLFIFSNQKSIMYDVATGDTVHAYPDLPGGPWVYPCGGSSTLLPLSPADAYARAEILICGGSVFGVNLNQLVDHPARATCGRIVATDPNPSWATEDMPVARAMGDMILLPTGDVVVINGAQTGSQGYERADNPALNPVLYSPDGPAGARFSTLAATAVPRMYHSTANLLADGRVLVAGSNPHFNYQFDAKYPTELSLEAYSPGYLDADRAGARPSIAAAPASVAYGAQFEIEVTVGSALGRAVEVSLASAPFATHSYSMGQRLVKLAVARRKRIVDGAREGTSYRYRLWCRAPPSGNVAPPGYYMAFAVNSGVPSVAAWIQLVP